MHPVSAGQRVSGMWEFLGSCGFAVSAFQLLSVSPWDNSWQEVECIDVASVVFVLLVGPQSPVKYV